jgi:Family of unknown function (DUF6477)
MAAAMQVRADRAVASTIRHGAVAYDRSRDLPNLLRVTDAEIADLSPAGRRHIVERLERANNAQRSRARTGHWTYDLNRHLAIRQALDAERAAMARAGSEGP